MEFVTDRTKEDVNQAIALKKKGWKNLSQKEKEEWNRGLKGCLNSSDLERMESAINELAIMLEVEVDSMKDNIPHIPTKSYFSKLLGNISILRATGYIYASTPGVPTLPINTYQKVNDMEQILCDIHQRLSSEYYYYCGNEIYCGEETGLLL